MVAKVCRSQWAVNGGIVRTTLSRMYLEVTGAPLFRTLCPYWIFKSIKYDSHNALHPDFVYIFPLLSGQTSILIFPSCRSFLFSSRKKSNQKIIDSYDYLSNAASAQDCTGLIPVGPTNRAELESYEEVYHYQPPKIDPEKCE